MIPDVPVTDQLLHALPKTDLHCHLDGSLRLQTMLDLADQQGVRLPADTVDGLAKAMKIGQGHGSLEEYLKGFEITLSVLQTEDALYRTAYELAIDVSSTSKRSSKWPSILRRQQEPSGISERNSRLTELASLLRNE